ncbi:hypothetical protein [Streptomyces fragilis]|uniref:hypothetical protein n=1 Tax=Streptomyces fragilis TaxID=67301 RepID=UPI0027E37886|nr:hypothetical protein [Streptomyces fragilis]
MPRDEEDVGTGLRHAGPRSGQADGTGSRPGREVLADGVVQQVGDGAGGKGHRCLLYTSRCV